MKEKMDEKWLKTDTPCSQGNPINLQQPQYQQPYSPCQPYAAPNGYAQQRSGLAIASMVLGIVSAAMLFMSLFVSYFITSIISFLVGIVGIVLAGCGKKDGCNSGMLTAGLVCSIVGLAGSVIVFMILSLM